MSKTATASIQIKVTLPEKLQHFMKEKADKYGLSLSSYIKYLVINDVRGENMPTFNMSESTENVVIKAIKNYNDGQVHEIRNVDDFLDNL